MCDSISNKRFEYKDDEMHERITVSYYSSHPKETHGDAQRKESIDHKDLTDKHKGG